MAALSNAGAPELLELNKLRAQSLNPVFEEETLLWQQRLDWDFRPSADLVRRFVEMKALNGYALVISGQTVGYTYFVCEKGKGLIGDLYVLRQFNCREYEDRLLSAVLKELFTLPSIERVEAQLVLLPSSSSRMVPYSEFLHRHPRDFMETDLDKVDEFKVGRAAGKVRIENWRHSALEETARLIAAAYSGHIDSEINDQYRSVAGARRFLLNIVQYPGCGSFLETGSFMALNPDTHELCGISLSSLVSSDIGHITQICTPPHARGAGIGYELLRHSLRGLTDYGCRKASLTVTSSNKKAIQLYQRMGFAKLHTFAAYVWEGF